MLLDERKIANYYDSFSLIFNKKEALIRYEILDNLVLNEELKEQMSELLNASLLEKCNLLAESRHKKAIKVEDKSKLDKKRSTKKYVQDSIKINNNLIKLNTNT